MYFKGIFSSRHPFYRHFSQSPFCRACQTLPGANQQPRRGCWEQWGLSPMLRGDGLGSGRPETGPAGGEQWGPQSQSWGSELLNLGKWASWTCSQGRPRGEAPRSCLPRAGGNRGLAGPAPGTVPYRVALLPPGPEVVSLSARCWEEMVLK